MGDFKPYIFKTTNYGKSWKAIGAGIPVSNSSFVHSIKEDPVQKGLLYAGTDNGLYISPDDGNTWHPLKNNLPPSPVYYIAIQKNFRDLVLATYGRGFYILDDITPIREWSKQLVKNKNELLAPRQAYRFNYKTGIHSESSMTTGSNPPYGASINYYLVDKLAADPSLFILNAKGDTIQKMKGTRNKGFNRVWWNLAHNNIELPPLKTIPDNKNYISLDSLGNRRIFIYDLDIGPGLEPIRIPPGSYTVVLKIDKEIMKQSLQVLADPNLHSSKKDIDAQYNFGLQLTSAMKKCLSLIEKMEIERAQLLKQNTSAALAREKQVYALEKELFDIHLTGSRMDIFRNPAKILERLLTLTKESQTMGADFPPTSQQKLVYQSLNSQLEKIATAYLFHQ